MTEPQIDVDELERELQAFAVAVAKDPDSLNGAELQRRLTPRQRGLWEIAGGGIAFTAFPPSWVSSVMAWYGAQVSGEPITPDQALELDDERLADLLMKAVRALGPTGGEEQPSPTPAAKTSRSTPASRSSATRRSTTSST